MALAQRLYAKGWTEEELAHLDQHVTRARYHNRFSLRFLYWFYLLLLVSSILAFTRFFFPLLVALPPLLANLTVAFLAGCFAALFGHVLHTLDELTHGHHALVMTTAVLTALLSSWFIVRQSLRLGVLFAVTFAVLYGYYWKKGYERNRAA